MRRQVRASWMPYESWLEWFGKELTHDNCLDALYRIHALIDGREISGGDFMQEVCTVLELFGMSILEPVCEGCGAHPDQECQCSQPDDEGYHEQVRRDNPWPP